MNVETPSVPTRTSSVNILMIDVSRALLEALPLALHRFGFLNVIARANDIEAGIRLLKETTPDIALIDGTLYRHSFREVSAVLPIRLGECGIALFANQLTDAQLDVAIQNRVQGFLSAEDSTADLAEQFEKMAAGRKVISQHLQSRLALNGRGEIIVSRRSDLAELTNRQLEVLTHLAAGLRVKEIADLMQLSVKAIESHKFRIMNRLNIRDRVQLCRWAIREGLIEA